MNKKPLKIVAYSAMNVAFLLFNEKLLSQIIYTDIDSDIVIEDEPLDYIFIDIDEDGVSDFLFLKENFVTPTVAFFNSKSASHIIVSGLDGKDIVMSSVTHTLPYLPAVSNFPLPFFPDNIISSSNKFIGGSGIMAYRSFFTGGPPYDSGGYWFPEFKNKYLGFRFPDDDGCMHYGWIRCSVLDSGSVLVIKDYAYETQCDLPILAGSTVSYVDIDETANNLNAQIYSNKNTIYCNIHSEELFAEMFIYALSGKKLYSQKLIAKNTEIDVSNFPAGIYVVEILSDDMKFVKKVVIE